MAGREQSYDWGGPSRDVIHSNETFDLTYFTVFRPHRMHKDSLPKLSLTVWVHHFGVKRDRSVLRSGLLQLRGFIHYLGTRVSSRLCYETSARESMNLWSGFSVYADKLPLLMCVSNHRTTNHNADVIIARSINNTNQHCRLIITSSSSGY